MRIYITNRLAVIVVELYIRSKTINICFVDNVIVLNYVIIDVIYKLTLYLILM